MTGNCFRALAGIALAAVLVVALLLFTFTDVWPYMHEVIWQQSWKPVCARPDGSVGFC